MTVTTYLEKWRTQRTIGLSSKNCTKTGFSLVSQLTRNFQLIAIIQVSIMGVAVLHKWIGFRHRKLLSQEHKKINMVKKTSNKTVNCSKLQKVSLIIFPKFKGKKYPHHNYIRSVPAERGNTIGWYWITFSLQQTQRL